MSRAPLENANPTVYSVRSASRRRAQDGGAEGGRQPIDEEEIFGARIGVFFVFHSHWSSDLIRSINDPEHPLTLEQLNVTQLEHISVDDANGYVLVRFTPTIPHCSMATLIGLCIRVRLLRSLPSRFKIDVLLNPGTHQSEHSGTWRSWLGI